MIQAAKEEVDARSIYVGNVDYAATPEELQVGAELLGLDVCCPVQMQLEGGTRGRSSVEEAAGPVCADARDRCCTCDITS